MKERIEIIIKNEGLSPSQFADTLGVQRSGISHILSGRNKPSLDFLNKLLDKFPHISGDWLITGKGDMIKSGSGKVAKNTNMQLFTEEKEPEAPEKQNKPGPLVKDEVIPNYHKQQKESIKDIPAINNRQKTIERIVIFYSDKTFTEYIQE